MRFNKEELRDIVSCIDFMNEHLRIFNKSYKQIEDREKYPYGYLNYLITLRNKIIENLNKRSINEK
jgi:hypothetical protein